MALTAEQALDALRTRGLRMTPQRQAIVGEIMRSEGHIAPQAIARRVKQRMPGVNASTIYRTLDLLEELGMVSHAHLEGGPEYHRTGEDEHIHLVCSNCGQDDELSVGEGEKLKRLINRHNAFDPDLTHFAISGLCADCGAAG
ncbi:MAG: transcriptional repressor [Actinobacteria bacterium]|nr:transcriptional repressor [Actinomycetota bacterium]